jgi:hypothetical protein
MADERRIEEDKRRRDDRGGRVDDVSFFPASQAEDKLV